MNQSLAFDFYVLGEENERGVQQAEQGANEHMGML